MGNAPSVEMSSKRSDLTTADGTDIDEGQPYLIEVVEGGTNVTLDGSGTKTVGWGIKGEKDQTWLVKQVDENVYTFQNAQTKSYLGVLSQWNGASGVLKASPTKWKTYKGATEDSYVLESVDYPGICFANYNGAQHNGNLLCGWTFHPTFYKRMSFKFCIPPDPEKEKKLRAARKENNSSTTETTNTTNTTNGSNNVSDTSTLNTTISRLEAENRRLEAEHAELLKSQQNASGDADAELKRLRDANAELRKSNEMQAAHMNEAHGSDTTASELALLQREIADLRKSLAAHADSSKTTTTSSTSTSTSDASLRIVVENLQREVADLRKLHTTGTSHTTVNGDAGATSGSTTTTTTSGAVTGGSEDAALKLLIEQRRAENEGLRSVQSTSTTTAGLGASGAEAATAAGGLSASTGGVGAGGAAGASALQAELARLEAEAAQLRSSSSTTTTTTNVNGGSTTTTNVTGGSSTATNITGGATNTSTHLAISVVDYARMKADIQRLQAEILVLSQRPIVCSVY